MKVSLCKKCKNYERKVWTHYYIPSNYHAIGMNHAYAYCNKLKERCGKVKNCT